jgi:hypothetical protein
MSLHLREISRHVGEGAHGVVLIDRAGWHGKLAGVDRRMRINLRLKLFDAGVELMYAFAESGSAIAAEALYERSTERLGRVPANHIRDCRN